ncbi:TerD family protein [Streptomyces sp. NPDC046197]|uniref:TerD family protein n=1 Tax=Streptomyces sp. NPDC046197 TaxID=3154337 RepID=UPI0033F412C7
MTAELVRGQNHPLSEVRLQIRISAGRPIVAAATLADENGRVASPEWVVHPGAPVLPGLEVSRQAAADHRLEVDLGVMPGEVHRVSVLLALPAGVGPTRFGALAAPFVAIAGPDGTELAGYTVTGLDAESAVVALEFYRRQGAWKVRAVGQGYAGGLAELFADQALPQARHLADTVEEAVVLGVARSVPAPTPHAADGDRFNRTTALAQQSSQAHPDRGAPHPASLDASGAPTASGAGEQPSASASGPVDYSHPGRRSAAPPPPAPPAPPAAPGQPAPPVAGDATGWSMDERLYNQVWGMFEDLARTTAAYRGAVDFADSRREKELDQVLSDPRSRIGGQGDAAREAARARHAHLVDQARAVLERDLAQLAAESDVVEPALPPAYARWDNPVWHGYRVPMEIPMAVRLGDLRLPESGDLRIPMLVRLPLDRGLWIDSGRPGLLDGPYGDEGGSYADEGERRRPAMDIAVAHAARLLAVYPPGEFDVHVIDPAGSGAQSLAPLVQTGVLGHPPAVGAAGVADVLGRLTRRVDLLQMAVRGGAADALPPGVDPSAQLLVVNDFPHGFDDRAVTQLRYLADEGPAVGLHLMMVADREDAAAYGPLLDPLWHSLLRLTPVADDHLADPWVGHAWTYEPPLVPSGSQVLQQVLGQVATARREWNR